MYSTEVIDEVEVEVYTPKHPHRILRLKHNGKIFKLVVEDMDGVAVIYLAHGELTTRIKLALIKWGAKMGYKDVVWGRDKVLDKKRKVRVRDKLNSD